MLEKLQGMRLAAKDDKDKKSILTLILSDANNLAKDDLVPVASKHVSAAAKKWIKRLNDAVTLKKLHGVEPSEKDLMEIEVVNEFLPQMMSEQESIDAVHEYFFKLGDEIKEKNQMGRYMKDIQATYSTILTAVAAKEVKGLLAS